MDSPDLAAALAEARSRVETELALLLESLPDTPARLREAMAHSLLAPGKRLRPILLLWSREAIGEAGVSGNGVGDRQALQAACGLECLHTYSLIHDDLPAMDDDDLRRGRPTCHVAFDEATAILAGDALQALGFGMLARGGGARAAQLVAMAADALGPGGMVGGQQLDLDAEGRDLAAEAIERIHLMKTGRMLGLALAAGALLAGADEETVDDLDAAGRALGVAFQGADDLLDVQGQARTLGKTPGKDQRSGKATMIRAAGMSRAQAWTRERGERGLDLLRRRVRPQQPAGRRLLALGSFLWQRSS